MLAIVGEVKINITLKNTTTFYLVVVDGNKILFHGGKDEAQRVYDNPELAGGYGSAEIVAPGETISNDFLKSVLEDRPQKSNNIFEA